MRKFIYPIFQSLVVTVALFGTWLPFNSVAQSWAPLGAKWTYEVGHMFSPRLNYREWQVMGDTIINGQTCRVIQRFGSNVDDDLSDLMITYEDSNRVYWWVGNQFSLLYDFNKQVGQGWVLRVNNCNINVQVLTTGFDTINGRILKYMTLSPISAFIGKVVQGIGGLYRPAPFHYISCQIMTPCNTSYRGLRCYEDSIIGYHNFQIAPSCQYVVSVDVKEHNPLGVSVFPNPTRGDLQVNIEKSDFVEYQITNSNGVLIQRGELNMPNNQINLGNCVPGVYFLSLQSGDVVQKCKLLISR